MKEAYNLAKSLNDNDLSKLISKLSSLLEKRKARALKKAEEQARKQEQAAQLIEQINALAAEKGVTLNDLGYVHQSSMQKPVKKSRARNKISAENQTYILVDGVPELVFTRKAKVLLDKGEAYRYNDLNAEQQAMARAATAAYNS